MEKKINIAQLLKDCPKGMELDCTIFENLEFDSIEENNGTYLIICRVKTEFGYNVHVFTEQGCYSSQKYSKCVIFPKGKTTWEGFVPPCKFKDGDIIFTRTNASKCNLENNWISIFKEYRNNRCACYVCLCLSDLELYHDKWEDELLCELCEIEENRFATEEEKQKLFQAIKDNGYKWNAETKTLEKLIEPKFKVGDIIQDTDSYKVKIIEVNVECYGYESVIAKGIGCIAFDEQDNWELIPNKFDINTLVSFESRVLVRNSDSGFWKPAFWGVYEAEKSNEHQYRNYLTTEGFVRHCIPYNDETKHLLGTANDCDEFYKTWEE